MKPEYAVAVEEPSQSPVKDYTIANTIRKIVIIQHYPDSRDMPQLTSINQILREAGYNNSVKVTDRTVITHVYQW